MIPESKERYLVRRLRVIKVRYNDLIEECILFNESDPLKEILLKYADLLDLESAAIKRTLDVLITQEVSC